MVGPSVQKSSTHIAGFPGWPGNGRSLTKRAPIIEVLPHIHDENNFGSPTTCKVARPRKTHVDNGSMHSTLHRTSGLRQSDNPSHVLLIPQNLKHAQMPALEPTFRSKMRTAAHLGLASSRGWPFPHLGKRQGKIRQFQYLASFAKLAVPTLFLPSHVS